MNGLVNGAAQVDGQRSYSRPVLQLPARVLLIWAVKACWSATWYPASVWQWTGTLKLSPNFCFRDGRGLEGRDDGSRCSTMFMDEAHVWTFQWRWSLL